MVQVPPKSGIKERRVSKELPELGAAPSASGSLQAAEETDKQLDQLDTELSELKARYDQYFLGLERFEPNKDRDSLKQRLLKLKSSYIRNTAVKFRAQALYAKYLSYERMWMRTAREMEEGTYRRDLFKARFRKEKRDNKAKKAATGTKVEKEETTDPHIVAPQELLDPPLPPAPSGPPSGTGLPPLVAPRPTSVTSAPLGARPSSLSEVQVPPAAGSPSEPPLVSPKKSKVGPPPPPPPSGGFSSVRPTSQPVAQPGARPAAPPMHIEEPRPISTPAAAAGARPVPPQPARPNSLPGVRIGPPPPPAGGAASAGVPDDKMKAIYNAYVSAKRQCKESTDGVTLESITRTINAQVPQLLKQHNAKAVDFKVVIKNGKATLKAVPRT